jgi:hypothetical protein
MSFAIFTIYIFFPIMPHLSFHQGEAGACVAFIRGGRRHGQIIYVHEGTAAATAGAGELTSRLAVPAEADSTKYTRELVGFLGLDRLRAVESCQRALQEGWGEDHIPEACLPLFRRMKGD